MQRRHEPGHAGPHDEIVAVYSAHPECPGTASRRRMSLLFCMARSIANCPARVSTATRPRADAPDGCGRAPMAGRRGPAAGAAETDETAVGVGKRKRRIERHPEPPLRRLRNPFAQRGVVGYPVCRRREAPGLEHAPPVALDPAVRAHVVGFGMHHHRRLPVGHRYPHVRIQLLARRRVHEPLRPQPVAAPQHDVPALYLDRRGFLPGRGRRAALARRERGGHDGRRKRQTASRCHPGSLRNGTSRRGRCSARTISPCRNGTSCRRDTTARRNLCRARRRPGR